MTIPIPFERPVTTPTEVNRLIRKILEGGIGELWVRGEITNFSRAASGHLYFSLKDRESQLRSVMWRTQALKLRFPPADGMEVEARGRISVYEPRGEYQLSVVEMSPSGIGARYLALEALKKKLQAEGFFDPARKRPIPLYPETVGIVTSPAGAALRDIVRVARRRWPSVRLVLAPVPVQGEGASVEIASAVRRLNAWGKAQVIIVGRGGGSMEDLWAFNEEPVVRAVARSRIPVISAVGHEVDVTLCDLAADRRAATPSHAAELAVPSAADLSLRVKRLETQMQRRIVARLLDHRRRVEAITSTYGFRRPRDFLAHQAQRVDDLARRLGEGTRRLARDGRRLIADVERRFGSAEARYLAATRSRLDRLLARLSGLDPLAVLSRGYCLVQREAGETVIRQAADLSPGERVRLRFSADRATARVEEVGGLESEGE